MNEVELELLRSMARGDRVYEYNHVSSKFANFLSPKGTSHRRKIDPFLVDKLKTEGYITYEPHDLSRYESTEFVWFILTDKAHHFLEGNPEAEFVPPTEYTPPPLEDVYGVRHVTISTKWGKTVHYPWLEK